MGLAHWLVGEEGLEPPSERLSAAAGDVLDVGFERLAGLDGVHPDDRVTARLHTAGGTATASFTSVHHGDVWRSAAVYRELFRRQATE